MTGRSETETSREDGGRASSPNRVARAIRHPVSLLVAAITITYLPALTTGTFFVRDLMLQYVPARAFLAASLAGGHVPLWNPLLHGGQPFIANPQNLLTYPPWIASFVLSLLAGLNLLIVLHLVLAAISAYWLGRVLGLSRTASFVVGFGFSFCGVVISLVNLTHMLFTLAWMPPLVGSFLRLRSSPSARRFALAGLSGGMCVLAGGAEMILVSFLTLGVVFVAFEVEGRRDWRRGLVILIAVVAISASIGAVRIWTTLDYLPETSRGERQAYSEMVRFSVHPHRLPELVAPGFMGSTSGIVLSKYWGRELEQAVPYLFSIHFGAGMLFLLVIGLTGQSLSRPMRIALALLAGSSILLALGRFLPGFEIFSAVPFVSRLRYPIKIITMSALPVALLSGAGIDALNSISTSARRQIAAASGVFGAVVLGIAVVTRTGRGQQFWGAWFGTSLTDDELVRLSLSLVIPAVVLLLLAFAAFQTRVRSIVVAGVVCLELLFAAQGVNSVAPRTIFDEPPHLELIRNTTGDGYFQRVRPERSNFNSSENSDAWFARWTMEVYELYTAYLWQVPQVLHSDFDGMAPDRVVALRDLAATGDATVVRNVLDVSAVRAVLMNDLVNADDIELARTFLGPGGDTLFLYENQTAGRARFVTEPVFASSKKEALDLLGSPGFDPRRSAVVEGTARRMSACDDVDGEILYERVSSDEVRLQISTACEGYLVLAESYMSGWTTTIDGQPATDVRANVAFTGVFLEPGRHEVVRRYRPPGLTLVFLASCFACAVMLLLLTIGDRGRLWGKVDSAQS